MGVVLCSTTSSHATGCLDARCKTQCKIKTKKMIKKMLTNMQPNAE